VRFKVIVVLAVLGSLALSGCSEQADPVCDELETLRGSIATLGDLTLEEGALEQLQSTVTQIQADAQAVRDAADEGFGAELGTFESTLRELADGVAGVVDAPSAASVAALAAEVGDTQQAWEALKAAAPDCEV